MRQLSPAEFARIEANLDRSLAVLVYRQNETDRLQAILDGARDLSSMSTKLKSLSGNLGGLLARLDAAAAAAHDAMNKAVDRADNAVGKVGALGKEINEVAANIEAMVGSATNGTPAK